MTSDSNSKRSRFRIVLWLGLAAAVPCCVYAFLAFYAPRKSDVACFGTDAWRGMRGDVGVRLDDQTGALLVTYKGFDGAIGTVFELDRETRTMVKVPVQKWEDAGGEVRYGWSDRMKNSKMPWKPVLVKHWRHLVMENSLSKNILNGLTILNFNY